MGSSSPNKPCGSALRTAAASLDNCTTCNVSPLCSSFALSAARDTPQQAKALSLASVAATNAASAMHFQYTTYVSTLRSLVHPSRKSDDYWSRSQSRRVHPHCIGLKALLQTRIAGAAGSHAEGNRQRSHETHLPEARQNHPRHTSGAQKP